MAIQVVYEGDCCELTIEEAWLYMPKPLKSLIRFLGMLMGAVVIVLCAI